MMTISRSVWRYVTFIIYASMSCDWCNYCLVTVFTDNCRLTICLKLLAENQINSVTSPILYRVVAGGAGRSAVRHPSAFLHGWPIDVIGPAAHGADAHANPLHRVTNDTAWLMNDPIEEAAILVSDGKICKAPPSVDSKQLDSSLCRSSWSPHLRVTDPQSVELVRCVEVCT